MGVCGCGCVWVWVCVGVGVFGCAISATSRARQRQTRRCRRRFRPRRSATAVSSGVGHPAPPRRIEIERKINRRRRVQRFLRQSRLFSFAPNLSRCCCRFFFFGCRFVFFLFAVEFDPAFFDLPIVSFFLYSIGPA